MRFYNPLYTRKWTKIFSPVSTFVTELGKQVGFSQTLGKPMRNDLSIEMPLMSDEHTIQSNDDDRKQANSTFFHILKPSPRSESSTKSMYNRYIKSDDLKTPNTDRVKQKNGYVKYDKNNSIYHQLTTDSGNDENNNTSSVDVTSNKSVMIPIPSKEILFNDTFDRFQLTCEHFIWITLITIVYFSWFIFIAGISIIHVIVYLIIILLYLLSDRTRRFAFAILIYLAYVLVYDTLHLIPNYTVSTVHIDDIYRIEKKLFGIVTNGQKMTLNEYFKINHIPILDILTGLCYLNWIPIPVAYSLYLYRYKTKRDYLDFALTFLLTNILGFVIYYVVPAAPPWYIEFHGFDMNIKAAGNPAGFIHFDQLIGIKVFSSIYSKNANVFAAIPSLHAAYPLITVLYGSLSKKVWLHIAFVLFTLGVWFSAVYSRHHYVIDVLAGGTCAVTAYIIYRLLSRTPTINRLLVSYSKLI